jgi:putative endonuclease
LKTAFGECARVCARVAHPRDDVARVRHALHHDEGNGPRAARLDSRGVEPRDRRVLEAGERRRLCAEARDIARAGALGPEDLHGDRARGLELVAANVRLRCGEIDLIMSDRGLCVFVEVRQRASTRYGGAAASIDARKQARVRAAAQAWLQHRCAGRPWPALRFDVVAIEGSRLHWLPGAF